MNKRIAILAPVIFSVVSLLARSADAQATYTLKPTPKTVAWGYYDAKAEPVLRVKSGDTVEIQTLITNSPKGLEKAGLPPDQVEQSLRDITEQVKDKGPGGHILTGPIYVEGAEIGDVLEVKILAIKLAIPYAYNAFGPGRGYIPDDYPYAKMKIIPLDDEAHDREIRAGHRDSAASFFRQHGRRAAGKRGPLEQRSAVDYGAATWTTRTSSPARRSTFRCTRPARSLKWATATPGRATAKWTSPRSKLRSSARFNSSCARTCT